MTSSYKWPTSPAAGATKEAVVSCGINGSKKYFLTSLIKCVFVSSVRSSSVYHGLLEGAAATFSNFSNSSDSKVKVKVKGPNMCYIFEKHGIEGYRI